MSLVCGCCWVFLWWVFPTSWLSEGQSVPYVLSSHVQVSAGCVGAGSSMCTMFWGFSLALVQLFVLSNFFTIYLYFQIGPGLTSCGFPSLLHLLLFLSAGVSFVGGFPVPGGILVFPGSTHSFFMVGLLRVMGVRAEPSLIRTLPGSCCLSSLWDEVQTLQIFWAPSPRWCL